MTVNHFSIIDNINKVLKDIKKLGQSIEDVENIVIKEVKNQTLEIDDLKKSVGTKADLSEAHGMSMGYQREIEEQLVSNKNEIVSLIETVREEIYDNVDEILQNHVNDNNTG
jgi:uncharacterized protein YdcH (DUF465 family)